MEITAADDCAIERLPEDLLVTIISLTSPVDACRAAAVSRAFRAAADSDAVWSHFLPIYRIDVYNSSGSSSSSSDVCNSSSRPWRKPLFLHLSGLPAFFSSTATLMMMWVDRPTGGKCFVIPARALHISQSLAWEWIPVTPHDSTWVSEAAMLLGTSDLQIRGKIHSRMLSKGTDYAAYMVFSLSTTGTAGLDYPFQEVSLRTGGGGGREAAATTTTRQACLHGYFDYGDGAGKVHRRHVTEYVPGGSIREIPLGEDVVLPRVRQYDGWLELELGEFRCEDGDGDGDGGEVSMSLTATKPPCVKRGLVLMGIEVRVKQPGAGQEEPACFGF